MARRIREFVDIKDHLSLDQLIDKLEQIRETLPQECSAELRLSGDEVFGRKLTISYLRELTASEEALEARYAAATLHALDAKIHRLREQLEVINSMQFGQDARRAVA
jgi:hypothetical protein